MMQHILALAKRFNAYQKVRFPVLVLAISLLPAIFSSAAVVSARPTLMQGVLVLIASVAYLFHIRVIDEHRDFEHDNQYHPDRPIQAHIISRHDLRIIDIVSEFLLIAIALFSGMSALVAVLAMLVYSYFAGKEFFIGERIRQHFFVYNGINLVQMLLMQIFVYSVFSGSLHITPILILHFLFTTVGTFIVEFIRKIKIPGDDGIGKDTYTWYLGFKNSLVLFSILILLSAALFFWLSTMISNHRVWMLVMSLCFVSYVYFTVVLHWSKKTLRTNHMMQLSFLSMYGLCNIVIYVLTINQ